MDPIKLSTTNLQKGVIPKSKIKMTPQMAQNELNRIYYIRSVAKSNARIEGQKKRNLVKLRQLKNKIIEKFSHISESIKIKIKL